MIISLAKYYYLVVGDRFELFYRGVIKSHNPYQYYIKATCEKGYTYNRYYTFTPTSSDVGTYKLEIAIYDDLGNVIESKETTLVVNDVVKVEHKNILCIGDSITTNGVWPYIGYSKYNEIYHNELNFVGKMKKEDVGYEGYGGWQWKTFCDEYNKSQTSSVWVTCKHNKTQEDQHSIYKSNDDEWILETILEDKLKFKRGNGNNKVNPEIASKLVHVAHGSHFEDIEVLSYDYSEGNPFFNPDTKEVDFKYYKEINKFEDIDYCFIMLTWNGQYMPYNTDFSVHEKYSKIIIDKIHEAFPKCKIGIMGIQLPCPNGGVTACYGASGYYHDWYGETITAFNYDEFLEEMCNREEYKDYLLYFDTKAQFDSEYNYYTKDMPVNNRSNITERIGVNGLHPSSDGYLQLGDAFYRFLIEMLKR